MHISHMTADLWYACQVFRALDYHQLLILMDVIILLLII